ncbi:hypothetical protein NDU88_001807, partial [Pleurodeles waltl]
AWHVPFLSCGDVHHCWDMWCSYGDGGGWPPGAAQSMRALLVPHVALAFISHRCSLAGT